MAWQEELRRLDSALAQGSITPDQHRRQREEILAEASGTPVASPTPAPLGRVEDQPGEPRWHAANPAAPTSPAPDAAVPDTPVPTVSTPAAAALTTPAPDIDRKPNKPSPATLLATDRPTTAPSPADVRSTDYIFFPGRGALPPAHSGLTMPMARVPGRGEAHGPVPVTSHPSSAPKPRGSGLSRLVISIGVVVALGALVGGAWWFAGLDTKPARGHAVPGSSTRLTPTADLEGLLPTLPGRPSPHNATMTVDEGVDLGLYPKAQAGAMKSHGAEEIVYHSSAQGSDLSDGYTVMVVATPSTQQARSLAEELYRSLSTDGFTAAPLDGHAGLTVLTRSDPAGRVSVVWYVSGEVTVGVGVSQRGDGDEQVLRQRLLATFSSLEGTLPPAG